jgi:hypothetical protein
MELLNLTTAEELQAMADDDYYEYDNVEEEEVDVDLELKPEDEDNDEDKDDKEVGRCTLTTPDP